MMFDSTVVEWLRHNYNQAKGHNPDPDPSSGRIALAYPVNNSKVEEAVVNAIRKYSQQTGIKFNSMDDISVVKYTAGSYCKYHSDISVFDEKETHKISLVVQLSDQEEYEGGRLILFDNGTPYLVKQQRGLAVLFPSFMYHKVEEVTGGERLTLVGWANGRNWQ